MLFRLGRAYTDRYRPSADTLHQAGHYAQPFENVHFASFLEGTAVFVNGGEETFLREYAENVAKSRLVWSYLLALHQRYALIASAADAAHTYRGGTPPTLATLSALIERLSKVQLKCLFLEISHHSHQNEFYSLCRESLRVSALYTEVSGEVAELNLLLNEQARREEGVRREETEHRREAEQAQASERERKFNTLLTVVGLSLGSISIVSDLSPNLFIYFCKWLLTDLFQRDFEGWKRGLSPGWLEFLYGSAVYFSNLAFGILVGFGLGKVLVRLMPKRFASLKSDSVPSQNAATS
ncbi:MAG: hypothetical protein H7Y12_14655 [Sphingobacteriaceae bacterium]|nr:hypothetical protein [Cytophagaceae bacterium]